MDTSSHTFNDVLTGLSAASASAQPHAAAGLSLANLVIGKTVDNINSTYYFEKTFQALASSIQAEREERKEAIRKNLNQPIADFTMYDALALVHRYDNACSIRVGLEKLQGIAQEAANKNATIAAKTTQLDLKEKELSSTKATVDALTTKLVTLVGSINGRQSGIVVAAFKKLKAAKNESERKLAIGEIEGILLSNEGNIEKIETAAGELQTTVGTSP
ncbi:hypothetical protein NHH73_17255 [Oxalobacteraceae bacterium OTU3CINTB1]|nr:hypothetical protein NHH73_17255 [Oxalobacteraceae bacterium OTU3CINTB1]